MCVCVCVCECVCIHVPNMQIRMSKEGGFEILNTTVSLPGCLADR